MIKVLRKVKSTIKDRLYFIVASYFAFFARIYLKRWNPTIITVTGSSGKTTTLHLLEAQLGDRACYSHNANSAFGIPFDILGLHRTSYRLYEWVLFILRSPFQAFRKIRFEKIYVTEADAERPGEGEFLAQLLRPHITVWLSLAEAHGVQYEKLLHQADKKLGQKDILEKLTKEMATEFGYFVHRTRSLAILNKSNKFIAAAASTSTKEIVWLKEDNVVLDTIGFDTSTFSHEGKTFTVPLIPPDAGLSVVAVVEALKCLGVPVSADFTKVVMPPGRSSVFRGISDTVLVDSTYNATISGVQTMLNLFAMYPASKDKWLVLGDMVEQGSVESYEHASIVPYIQQVQSSHIVLVGPRLAKHTAPLLDDPSIIVVCFDLPSEAYEYMTHELKGGETILFKGARYLEGIVEKLLHNKEDAERLCRRGRIWDQKRAKWGV